MQNRDCIKDSSKSTGSSYRKCFKMQATILSMQKSFWDTRGSDLAGHVTDRTCANALHSKCAALADLSSSPAYKHQCHRI